MRNNVSTLNYDCEAKDSWVLRSYENPVKRLPEYVQMDLEVCYFETGRKTVTQDYFENYASSINTVVVLSELITYGFQKDDHKLLWNIMVVVSQLEYATLGKHFCMLALGATRSKYLDIQELGIRCFENWENKKACEFLKHAVFEEKWLREYAQEVIEYVMEDGQDCVLPEKDYTWQMAKRDKNFESYPGRRAS